MTRNPLRRVLTKTLWCIGNQATTMERLIRTGILLGLVMFSIVGVIALLTEDFKTEQVVFMLTMVVGSLVIGKLMIEEGEL